jgi:hypothetical protein
MQRIVQIASVLLTTILLTTAALAEDATGVHSQNAAVFHPQLVWRSVTIKNFSGKSIEHISMKGTELAPEASAQVKVTYAHGGAGLIDVEANGLPDSTHFGQEILTYLVWAVDDKGEAIEIGELQRDGNRAWMLAPTYLQAFALLVTAEPYSQVARPSDQVVLDEGNPASGKAPTTSPQPGSPASESVARTGVEERSLGNTKRLNIQLLADAYRPADYKFAPIAGFSGASADELGSRNARRIALLAKADKYAPTAFKRAEELFAYYQSLAQGGSKTKKQAREVARVAASEFDTARALSLKKQFKVKK